MTDASQLKADVWTIIEPLHGWCTQEKADALVDLVLTAHPRTCVEIGVFGGRSLIAIGMALRTLNEGGMMTYGIDPWRLEAALDGDVGPENRDWWSNKVDLDEIHRSCIAAIWAARLEPWVTVIRAASQHVAHLFVTGIDVLHVDGCHSEASSLRDVSTYVPLVNDGGYVLFDDSDWATTQKAVRLLDATLHRTGAVGSCLIYRRV